MVFLKTRSAGAAGWGPASARTFQPLVSLPLPQPRLRARPAPSRLHDSGTQGCPSYILSGQKQYTHAHFNFPGRGVRGGRLLDVLGAAEALSKATVPFCMVSRAAWTPGLLRGPVSVRRCPAQSCPPSGVSWHPVVSRPASPWWRWRCALVAWPRSPHPPSVRVCSAVCPIFHFRWAAVFLLLSCRSCSTF